MDVVLDADEELRLMDSHSFWDFKTELCTPVAIWAQVIFGSEQHLHSCETEVEAKFDSTPDRVPMVEAIIAEHLRMPIASLAGVSSSSLHNASDAARLKSSADDEEFMSPLALK